MKEKHVNESKTLLSGRFVLYSYSLPTFLVPHIPTVSLPFCFFSLLLCSVCIFLPLPYLAVTEPRAQDPSSDPWLHWWCCYSCVSSVSLQPSGCMTNPLHLTHMNRDSAMLTHGSLYKHTFLMHVPLFTPVYIHVLYYTMYYSSVLP